MPLDNLLSAKVKYFYLYCGSLSHPSKRTC
jgi:hypothetical protein